MDQVSGDRPAEEPVTEEELIEALGDLRPDWRDHYDDPFEAAADMDLLLDYDEGVEELRFDE